MKLTVKYYTECTGKLEFSHHYEEHWEKDGTINFCPNCGKSGNIWTDCSNGDYYTGVESICVSCKGVFNLSCRNSIIYEPKTDVDIINSQDWQRLTALNQWED